jgi:hypothetical protein
MAHTVIRVRFLEALLGTLIGPASARGIAEQSGICRLQAVLSMPLQLR